MARALLLVYLAALALRAVVAWASPLNPDGAVELQVAAALAEARWADALDARFHPLYAALVALASLLGLPAEAAARALAALCSSAVAPLAGWSAARLAPERPVRAAAVAGLLAAAQPALVRLGGQVMAYGLAHALLAVALAAAVAAAARPTLRSGALAGAAIGLGWTARSDALATGAGLVLGLGLTWLARRDRRGLAAGAALALGLLVAMAPYGLAMRARTGEWRLSMKKRAADLLPRLEAPPAATPSPPPVTLETLARLDANGGRLDDALDAASTAPPLASAALFATGKLVSAAHWLLLALAAVGVAVLARARAPAAAVAPLALLSFGAAQALLKHGAGYTSDVHCSAAGVLVVAPAAVGLLALAPSRGAARLALAAALLPLLPKALDPQRAAYRIEREIGRALREAAGAGRLVVAGRDARVVAHHAGAAYVELPAGPPAEAVAALRRGGARFLVVFVRQRPPRGAPAAAPPARVPRALREAGAAPFAVPAFTVEREGVRYDWLVFDLQEPRPS